jgi:hypothetical protein
VQQSAAGDLLLVARKKDNTLAVILAAAGSTSERQLLWLFGFENQDLFEASVHTLTPEDSRVLDFTAHNILEAVDLQVVEKDDELEHLVAEEFGTNFPSTSVFSEFARNMVTGIAAKDDPDAVLMMWNDVDGKRRKTLSCTRASYCFGTSGKGICH